MALSWALILISPSMSQPPWHTSRPSPSPSSAPPGAHVVVYSPPPSSSPGPSYWSPPPRSWTAGPLLACKVTEITLDALHCFEKTYTLTPNTFTSAFSWKKLIWIFIQIALKFVSLTMPQWIDSLRSGETYRQTFSIYKAQQIPILKCFSSCLAVVSAQSIEARC